MLHVLTNVNLLLPTPVCVVLLYTNYISQQSCQIKLSQLGFFFLHIDKLILKFI